MVHTALPRTTMPLSHYFAAHLDNFEWFHISVWFRCFSVAQVWMLAEMAKERGASFAPTLHAIADVRLENEASLNPLSQAHYAVVVEVNDLRAQLDGEWLAEYRSEPCFDCGGAVRIGAECAHC